MSLALGNQFVSQMAELVREAVFGNVGTLVAFRVGPQDAELLAKEFRPFSQADLVNLGFAETYMRVLIDGTTSEPFAAQTLPPLPRPVRSYRDTIIRVSRERYATPRALVEERIRPFTA